VQAARVADEHGRWAYGECGTQVVVDPDAILRYQIYSRFDLESIIQRLTPTPDSVCVDFYIGAEDSLQIAQMPLTNTSETHEENLHDAGVKRRFVRAML
jgi:hypothetical protein